MPNELRRRLAITVAAIVATRVLLHVPLPLLDPSTWRAMFDSGVPLAAAPPGAVGTPGLQPYLSAAVALTVLRALRGRPGRVTGERSVLALGLVIAAMQGLAYAIYLENVDAARFALTPLVPHPGGWFRLTSTLTCGAGTLLSVWLANVISVRGIGNGVCLIAGTQLLCWAVDGAGPQRGTLPASDGAWVAAIGVSLAWILAGAVLFRARWDAGAMIHNPRVRESGRVFHRVAGVGVAGMSLALVLVGLPATLAGFLPPSSPATRMLLSLGPPGLVYQVAFVVLAFLLTAMFTAWAYDAGAFERVLARNFGPPPDGTWLDEPGYQAKLERVALPIALLVPLAVTLSTSISFALGVHPLAPTALLVLAAIVLDTRTQWRLHRTMAAPRDPALELGDLLRCPGCGAWSEAEQAFCPGCGAERDDGARCERHAEEACVARCVACHRRLCPECRWSYDGRALCDDHHGVELIEGWACASTPGTTVEAGLQRQRLEEHGLHPLVLVNTVAPFYGTAGLFEVRPWVPFLIPSECLGGGIRVLVRPVDHDRATSLLAASEALGPHR